MSKIEFRPRGGQDGISLTDVELAAFNRDNEYQDEVVPLPDGNKSRIGCGHENTEYWETNTGSHGWCCTKCGEVTQWG